MRKSLSGGLAALSGFGLVVLWCTSALSQEVPRITKEEVKEVLGKPDVVVVDVRAAADWKDSTTKIKGAVREELGKIDSWMNNYGKDKTLIFYCA